MRNFRTYQLAKEFYQMLQNMRFPAHLKDQLNRASSSIVLNLAEGYGRSGPKEQRRFFQIAMGSLRECQAIIHSPDPPSPIHTPEAIVLRLIGLKG